MNLFFETQTGSTFSIEVGYWDTVLKIKKKIEKYQGVPVSDQTLFFQGNCLLEDDLDMEKCKIFHNSRLQVFVSPFRNANHSSDQVLQIKQSPVSSNSVGDIIFGQDLPMTTEHFMNIQAFYPYTTEEITPVTVGSTKNNNQVLQTEQSTPLESAEQIINDQDLPVTVQVQAALSNSVKEIINVQDSSVKGRSSEKVPKRIKDGSSNNNNNNQVLQTEECPPLKTVKEIVHIQESPVKMKSNDNNTQVLRTEKSPPSNSNKEIIKIPDSRWKTVEVKMAPMKMIVFVLLYSGESKGASKIPVEVSRLANVEILRKELVKIQHKHQLNLPQEGYFFIHRESKMVEDQPFWWTGVNSGDTIEISPRHVTSGS